METGSIRLTGPFDLSLSLYCGQAFRWSRWAGHGWHYGVIHGNLVKLRQTSLGLEWESTPAPAPQLRSSIKSYFRLNDNLPRIYESIGTDDRMRCAIGRYRGMSLLQQEPWECLVSYLCSINCSIPRIGALVELLSRRLGVPLPMDGQVRYTFPVPSALAEVGEAWLRQEIHLGFRARYIAEAAQAVASGRLDLENLRGLPYEVAKEELMKLNGVGEKVADCVSLFSLGKLEAFPVDRWVRRAVQEGYFPGRRITDREVRLWAQGRFGPYAGYAQQYLFHAQRQGGNPHQAANPMTPSP